MRTWLSIGCVVLLAGCTAVVMKEPFPETKLTEKEQEQIEGVWQLDESVLNIAFTTNGIPWMAWTEWEDEDFQLTKCRLHFTKHNDTLYACMPVEPGETNQYHFLEFTVDDGNALVWSSNVEVFEKWIEVGTLAGAEEDEDGLIVLKSSAKEILELISTNSAAFNYKEPTLLRKLR